MSDGRTRAVTMLVAGACVIGLAPILVRLSAAGPAATGFWRLAFALPLLALSSRGEPGGLSGTSRFAVMAGAAFALDLACWHYGIANTSVSKASVLANLTPLVVTAIAWFVFRQRPAPLFLIAVALSVTGGAVMALSKGAGVTGPNPLLGDALSAGTSVWYALYFLTMAEGRKTETTSRLMFWVSVVGAPLMLISALLLGEPLWPGSPLVWGACVGLGLMHVTGQGSIAWAMGRLPIATASVVVLIQPIVAAWLGWMLFAEPIGPLQALGAAVTLGGVVLAQLSSRRSA